MTPGAVNDVLPGPLLRTGQDNFVVLLMPALAA
ncbi:hypothetical protein QF038_000429 [Pseudarthrobacter sp. W1I19]|nr:hypothetical protein [Pseudarthrobacter sp. W1I19]